MDLGGDPELLQATLDVLESRLNQDGLPTEPGESGAGSQEPLAIEHRAGRQVREAFTFQRKKALHPLNRIIAGLHRPRPFPTNPVAVIGVEGKRLFFPGVDHHNGLGDLGAPDDVMAVAHDA